jgi:predicted DNA binding CopG/RHH family protein
LSLLKEIGKSGSFLHGICPEKKGNGMKTTFKKVPKFNNENEERKFWATHDTTDYVDLSTAKRVRFPNLKPSTETISLRLPSGLLFDLKNLANRRDIPYQSLLKQFLFDKVKRELVMH